MIEKNAKSIVIILVAIIVFLVTHKYGTDNEIVSHVGFAGTLISIILAVIAIIYTFYQSSMYQSSTIKLDQSADKIRELTNNIEGSINTLSEDIKSVGELKKLVETLEESVGNVNEVASSIHTGVDFLNQKFDVLGNAFFNANGNFSKTSSSEVDYSYNYEQTVLIVNGLNGLQISSLYYIFLAYQSAHKTIEFRKLIPWLYGNVEQPDHVIKETISYIYGSLGILTIIGVFKLTLVEENVIEVDRINQVFSDAFINAIKNIKSDKDNEIHSLLIQVEEYFGQQMSNQ